ncbi:MULTISPECIES: hypothetical protein [unclassified Novosphingobium]|uniref:hypothetical protein n=1 Tax=unclassified Novosphingobium TaxID=2644732 RepID=UPI000D311B2B|nr:MULTISPECIES: hypothetical protein [unclassified Novosphingobium]PTR06451.1 hypothetical protein C8K11_12064 [Novosphingobium sp. GV055]PUA94870.1 hypothetical protein C8K12_12064 [Novosphingobium sp. GV061]PUB13795.1 hypothetical protein C8K14_12064 [Novosphingobium sp. GV079]PUB38493.1 hypothetical protein C8K10_12064 [Novosphingobium sp. GV027]
MADNVIKEFLVSLGFKVEGQDKFDKGLDAATAKAVAMGEAIYDLAKQVAEAMARILPDLDQLYWRSQRLGSSAAGVRAYGYAISQLGGSAQGAMAALEGIAEFAKSSPNAGSWFVGALGVDRRHLGDAVEMAKDLSATFQKMPYFRAKAYASMLGIDPIQLQAMIKDTGEYEKQYEAMATRLGVNLEGLSGKSNDAMTRVRELKAELSLAFDVAEYKALEWLIPKLEEFSRWVNEIMSGRKLTGISLQLRNLINDIGDLLHALGDLAATPYMMNFAEKLTAAIDHSVKAISALVRVVTHVLNGEWAAAYREAINAAQQTTQAGDSFMMGVIGAGSGQYQQGGGASGGWGGDAGAPGSAPGAGAGGGINAGNLRNPNGIGFQKFRSTADALVAMGRQLVTYQKRDDLNTIAQILYRYAPPNENNTEGYIQFVSKMTGFARNQALNLSDASQLEKLMYAMIRMEKGRSIIGHGELLSLLAANAGRVNTPFAGRAHGGVVFHQHNQFHAHGGNSRDVTQGVMSQQEAANQRLVSSAGVFAY